MTIGRYRVRRLMRQANIVPVWKRKFVQTTNSKHDLPVAENLPIANSIRKNQIKRGRRTSPIFVRVLVGYIWRW